jgi:hypothetical protein
MKIEFDPKKRAWTLKHRGLDFADARYIFDGVEITMEDASEAYGESRYLTIGTLNGRVVVVAWTPRDRGDAEVIRIISMRNANEREIETFREQFR